MLKRRDRDSELIYSQLVPNCDIMALPSRQPPPPPPQENCGLSDMPNVLNVLCYGVVGDGITDDSDAILAVINSVSNGGMILFPPGIYKITKTLSFSNLRNVVLQGFGKSSILQDNIPSTGQDVINHLFTFDKTCKDVEINQLSFDSVITTDDTKQYCLGIMGPRFVVQNCSFNNFNTGISIREVDASKNSQEFIAHDCKIMNCLIQNMIGAPSGMGYGVITAGKRTIISGNSFINVGRHDVYLSGASYPNGGAHFCTVQNNTSESCLYIPIALNAYTGQLGGSSFHVIDGNTIRDCGGTRAMAISNNSCDNVISNNTICLSAGFGIALEGGTTEDVRPSRNTIIGNNIRDCANVHISCINGANNIFTGNVLSSIDVVPTLKRGIQLGKAGDFPPPLTGNIIGDNIYIGLDDAPFLSPVFSEDTDPPFGTVTHPTVQFINPPPDQGGAIRENAGIIFATAAEFDPATNTGVTGTGYSLYLPRAQKGKTITIIRTDVSSKKIAIMTTPIPESGQPHTIKIDGEAPEYETSAAKFFPPNTANKRVTLISDGIGWYSIV